MESSIADSLGIQINTSFKRGTYLLIYLENKAAVNYRITGTIEELVFMTGDQTFLKRLFVNLIDKSIKYEQKGNVIVLELKQPAEQINLRLLTGRLMIWKVC